MEFIEGEFSEIEGDSTYTLHYICHSNGSSYGDALKVLREKNLYEKKNPLKSRFNMDSYASAICDKEVVITLKSPDLKVRILFPKLVR